MRRHIIALESLIVVPRCICPDDAEVLQFLADEMLNFKRSPMGAWELFAAARDRFGDFRCIGVKYSIH